MSTSTTGSFSTPSEPPSTTSGPSSGAVVDSAGAIPTPTGTGATASGTSNTNPVSSPLNSTSGSTEPTAGTVSTTSTTPVSSATFSHLAAQSSGSSYIDYALSTTIRITSFPTPTLPATPSYLPALPDGTLMTPLYAHHARDASVLLFSAALFGVVFLRNIAVAYRYIRRISARDKTLFYLLFFSQIWGPVACAALLIPLASKTASCTAVNIVAVGSAEMSFSVLVSGILGIKAYRCLNRSRAVLAAICLTQVTAWILTAFDLPHLGSTRSLADICTFKNDLRLLPTAFILSSIETLVFVSMCFGYAVWHASKRSANLGRISLDVSTTRAAPEPALRGWWDYAPSIPPSVKRNNTGSSVGHSNSKTHVSRAASTAASSWKRGRGAWAIFPFQGARKPAENEEREGWEKVQDGEDEAPREPGRGWTNGSGQSPKFARMVLLNDAVRNELFYTALILVFHTLAMVMVPISLKYERVWPPLFWLGLSWTITSLLIIQSFAPVVARHEREAILREPALLGQWGAFGPDPLDAPSGPPRPKQTPWGRAVSFSTNSIFSSSTSPVSPQNLNRRTSTATSAPSLNAAAALWATTVQANPFTDSLSPTAEPDVWRRGSVSGMSMASNVSRPPAGRLRPVPSAYTSPGQTYAVTPPVPERRTSVSSSVVRKGSAESLLLR
ncbi:hypothetical protein EXIGLDRAFT_484471 [Exidia glandulosa HHB12029]|uniref:Uncharacterized protein n=1 Tax=Exidia glandulosa HHB12029 TaxID=1314781 RepID=A0A165PK74_EXIGL|nr:hypothetical protein EXIGLDRAFT_484471 [Exidia glandulosa HHB12029]